MLFVYNMMKCPRIRSEVLAWSTQKKIESGSDYRWVDLNPGIKWSKEKEAFKDSPAFSHSSGGWSCIIWFNISRERETYIYFLSLDPKELFSWPVVCIPSVLQKIRFALRKLLWGVGSLQSRLLQALLSLICPSTPGPPLKCSQHPTWPGFPQVSHMFL